MHTLHYNKEHISYCQLFIENLSTIQEKLLFLKIEEAKQEFTNLFLDGQKYFILFTESLDINDGKNSILLKKQAELIVKKISGFVAENNNLHKLDHQDIISLFERQFKLKKVIQKHLNDYKLLKQS